MLGLLVTVFVSFWPKWAKINREEKDKPTLVPSSYLGSPENTLSFLHVSLAYAAMS